MNTVSIIIPTLNEELCLATTINLLQERCAGSEIIVSDGGSSDKTIEIAETFDGVTVLRSKPGRGQQLGFGANRSTGDCLWFIHADTIPSPLAFSQIQAALEDTSLVAGNFTISFDGSTKSAKVLTWIYPRLNLLGLIYGDSGIFVRRSSYLEVGGFKDYPIFEDLDLVRRLKRIGKVSRLAAPIITSSRRFEGKNFALVFAWWTFLQILFWIGVSPFVLGKMYRHVRSSILVS